MWGRLTLKWTGRNNPPRNWGTAWSESREVSLFHFCDTPCMQAEWTWCCCGRKCQCHCGSLAFGASLDAAGEVQGFGKRSKWKKSWLSCDLFCWRRVPVWFFYCVLWLFWFWISITELEYCQIWDKLQSFIVKYLMSQSGSRCSTGLS